MLKHLQKFVTNFSNAQILAIALTSIAVMLLFSIKIDILLTLILLTAYTIFCSWTATIAVKEYLTSRHFKKFQHRRLYERIETNAFSVLVTMFISFILILSLNRDIFIAVIAIVISISTIVGHSYAKDEISSKFLLSEMSEDKYSKRLDIIRSAIEDLKNLHSIEDFPYLIGSIDYCVNYLPIDYFFCQFDFFYDHKFKVLITIVMIANSSSIDRFEDDIREMLIDDVRSARLSIDDLLYYFNDTERK